MKLIFYNFCKFVALQLYYMGAKVLWNGHLAFHLECTNSLPDVFGLTILRLNDALTGVENVGRFSMSHDKSAKLSNCRFSSSLSTTSRSR